MSLEAAGWLHAKETGLQKQVCRRRTELDVEAHTWFLLPPLDLFAFALFFSSPSYGKPHASKDILNSKTDFSST